MESWEAQISAVAALDEPTRRRLYDYVVRQPESVSRDDAAAALELPRTTAAFHLDRLVDEGLLDVVYQRRNGRTGPGAGRPAKLYQRSHHHVAVSLPQRRYDLAGRLLSSALEQAERSGDSPRAILDQRAYQLGKELGDTARSTAGDRDTGDTRDTRVLSVVDIVDDAFIGVADDWGVRKPRPVVVGGALVGLVTGCSAW